MSKIHTEAMKGNLDSVKKLIDSGVDINSVGKDECTIIHCAAYKGQIKIVEYLISIGADLNKGNKNNYTPLMVSSRQGYVKIVQILIENGAIIDQKDDEGFTALILASGYSQDPEVVSTLIKAKANINATTNTGGSSLLWATWFGLEFNVRVLLLSAANKEIGFNGKKPIDIAREKGFNNIEKMLIEGDI